MSNHANVMNRSFCKNCLNREHVLGGNMQTFCELSPRNRFPEE